jgi:hypothetical protein
MSVGGGGWGFPWVFPVTVDPLEAGESTMVDRDPEPVRWAPPRAPVRWVDDSSERQGEEG